MLVFTSDTWRESGIQECLHISLWRRTVSILSTLIKRLLASKKHPTQSSKLYVPAKKSCLSLQKKQAKDLVAAEAQRLNMPYVTERWLGGMLTNFATIRKSLKKMSSLEKLMKEDGYKNLAKKERLMVTRQKEKMETILGGIADLSRLPAALFVVDIKREHIAIAEAQKLGIPVFALVDTNSNPNEVEFPIPANDDAFKSVSLLVHAFGAAIEEGLSERKRDKDDAKISEEEEAKRAVDAETKE